MGARARGMSRAGPLVRSQGADGTGASESSGSSGSPGTNDSVLTSSVGGRPAAASEAWNAPDDTATARTASRAAPAVALTARLSAQVRDSQPRMLVRSSGATFG